MLRREAGGKKFFIALSFFTLCVLLRADNTLELSLLSSGPNPPDKFGTYYVALPVVSLEPKKSIALPLPIESIENYSTLSIPFSSQATELLRQNGFVVTHYGQFEDARELYQDIRERDIPIVITTDMVLHYYSAYFLKLFESLEEDVLYSELISFSRAMLTQFQGLYESSSGDIKEAARRNIGFFIVGLKLLGESVEIPTCVFNEVQWELAQIEQYAGTRGNLPEGKSLLPEERSLFFYAQDYTNYLPSGHYLVNARREQYYKGYTWYSNCTFLLEGTKSISTGKAQKGIAPGIAKMQTLQAALIAAYIDRATYEGKTALDSWEKIFSISSYSWNLSHLWTIYAYRDALRAVFGKTLSLSALENAEKMSLFQERLLALSQGEPENDPVKPQGQPSFSGKGKDGQSLKGMSIFGKKFFPDAHIFSQLTYPAVGVADKGEAARLSTSYELSDTTVRGFSTILDLFAALGVTQAQKNLESFGYSAYAGFSAQLEKVKREVTREQQNAKTKNIYWGWLECLSVLGNSFSGAPAHTQTDAALSKQLNTAAGSWIFMRNGESMFYEKTQDIEPGLSNTAMSNGYVEPSFGFYEKILAMTRMLSRTLKSLGVLSGQQQEEFGQLEDLLLRLRDIIQKELVGQDLSQDDYSFINAFPEQCVAIVLGKETKKGLRVIQSTCFSSGSSGVSLHAVVGYFDLLLLVYPGPQGKLFIGGGPAFSYYEMKNKNVSLGEAQIQSVLSGAESGHSPEWVDSFRAE